jgi:hypothetical protein
MPKLLTLLFLLADPELLSDILRWGQECGLMIVVVSCAPLAGNVFHGLIHRRKTPLPGGWRS